MIEVLHGIAYVLMTIGAFFAVADTLRNGIGRSFWAPAGVSMIIIGIILVNT